MSCSTIKKMMAAGVPVIATTVGGVPEIAIANETALLVEKQNPTELAKALERLLGDSELRKKLGGAGKEISRNYDPEVYCHSMVQLYQQHWHL